MKNYERMFQGNRAWAERLKAEDPEYFLRQSQGQAPHSLFIGCSDSRVPANTLTQTDPGEMFVHRNVANQVFASDLNCLTVIQYAVEVLDVKHIIVCGHHRCGGVNAALGTARYGLVDHWLGDLRTLRDRHARELAELPDHDAQLSRLVELNVLEQVYHLTLNPTVRAAWERGPRPIVHGLVYGLEDGLLHELVSRIDSPKAAAQQLPQLGGSPRRKLAAAE